MKCRKNVKNLTPNEKQAFVEALYAVRSRDSVLNPGNQSRYDDFVQIHRDAMFFTTPDPAHSDSAFFPWHRELIWRFEKELQITHPDVRVPYWDWTRAHAAGDAGWPFTFDFLGPDGDNSDDDKVKREAGAPTPYPHPFDPENWDITVKDGGEPDYLQRDFASRPDAQQLPENDTVVPDVASSFRDAIADIGYELHRARSESIHNLVHRWVAGNMLTASSPNDPVFFLHHAAIDRMWTLWQERNNPADPYVNTSGATGHVEDQPMVFGTGTAPWSGSTNPADVIDGHAMHGDGVWYDTDLPEITNETGSSLAFNNVPEGLTAYRAVRFRVKTCRPMRFRITAISGSPYGLTSLGSDFLVDTGYDPTPVDALVWAQYDSSLGSTAPGSLEIEASIIDPEGYYAATEGGTYVLGTWTISLSASIVPRVGTSLAMVLDRSGSMASAAGGGSTRTDLMKSAVSVFHALLNPADEIGLVGFDHETVEVLPFGPASAGLGGVLAPGGDLDPRGSTGIGAGIQAGAAMLGGASHAREALLVLTDGNENVHPYVNELPAGTITSATYAIGFGLPGEVSDSVLNQITQNSGGDLIITGNLATDAEQFLLTKYFLQILAGIQSQNVVLDPEGALAWGSKQVLDVPLSHADVAVDIIVLCPIAPWLEFRLITPGGKELAPHDAVSVPNAEHILHPRMQAWRLQLPALPPDSGASHGGVWKVVLSLKRPNSRDFEKLSQAQIDDESLSAMLKGLIPWSCIVHATSNVQFDGRLTQTSLEPGAWIELNARLTEYLAAFHGEAQVWAEISDPQGAEFSLELDAQEDGNFNGGFTADQAGLYRVRLRAEGYATAGGRFLREKTLSASLFLGGDQPPRRESDDEPEICRLLQCLLHDKVLNPEAAKRLQEFGVNLDALRRCLCGSRPAAPVKPGRKPDLSGLKQRGAINLARLISEAPSLQKIKPLSESVVISRERKREGDLFPPITEDKQVGSTNQQPE